MTTMIGLVGMDERPSLVEMLGAGRILPSGSERCACRYCGSHVHAVVLKQTISGLCGTCGGCDIAPLKH